MPKRAIPPTDLERQLQSVVMKKLRDRAGLEVTPAAAAVGISASQLTRYESGENMLPTNYIRLVARAYHVTQGELIAALGLLDEDMSDGQRYPVLKNLLAVGVDPVYAGKLDGDLADKDEATRRSVTEDAIADYLEAEESRRRSG